MKIDMNKSMLYVEVCYILKLNSTSKELYINTITPVTAEEGRRYIRKPRNRGPVCQVINLIVINILFLRRDI